MQQVPQRFIALDSWRGVCACLVALHHICFQYPRSHLAQTELVLQAWLAVDFFFVLSGFVIAANYQDRLLKGFGVARFMLLRFGRVYPLHLAVLLAYLAYELIQWSIPVLAAAGDTQPFATPEQAPETIIANLLLVNSLHLFDFYTWNLPSWSISVEFYTYLIFALGLMVFRNRILPALAVVLIASPFLFVGLGRHDLGATYDWGLLRSVFGFAAGVVAFHIWHHRENDLRAVLGNPVIASVAEIVLVALVAVFGVLAHLDYVSMLAPYLFGVVILVFSLEAGVISRLFMMPPIVILGMLSYSIYMIHFFIIGRADAVAKVAHEFLDTDVPSIMADATVWYAVSSDELWLGDLFDLAMMAVVVAVSFITYRLIEEPGRHWSRKLADRFSYTRA